MRTAKVAQRARGKEGSGLLEGGELVDHFKVVRLVGRGGMGEVYLARDTKLGRRVALKVVRAESLGDRGALERFLFEARVTARFSHPNIVGIYSVGEHCGQPYVALEYLEGESLRERLAAESLPLREGLRIGLAVAEALAEAHDHGVLHRDLKPENVVLPRDGRVRVVDFGLARTFGPSPAEPAAEAPEAPAPPPEPGAGATRRWGPSPTPRGDRPAPDAAATAAADPVPGEREWTSETLAASPAPPLLEDLAPGEGDWTSETLVATPYAAGDASDTLVDRPFVAPKSLGLPAAARDRSAPSEPAAAAGRARPLEPSGAPGLAARREPAAAGPGAGHSTALQPSDVGLVGTPPYMAPEQWRLEPATSATDLWALGVILFEVLAGRQPFRSETLLGLCDAICGPEVAPGLDEARDLPAGLSELVAACLQKDPAARPSAREAVEALGRVLFRGEGETRELASPFRGLLPFAEQHAALFFGRDREVAAFLERLREDAVLPVVGPSGAGKSSFVRAGVIPRLREGGRWVVLALRPGRRPFEALAARLRLGDSAGASGPRLSQEASGRERSGEPPSWSSSAGSGAEARLSDQLAESPARLGLELNRIAEEEGCRVLLFVDQLEEVYTLVEDEELRRRFVEALATAADDVHGPVRVAFTLRDDFLGRVAETPAARQALGHITVVRSPDPKALLEIVTRPLEAFGYRYADPELPARMVAEVGHEPACLPLLQFACAQLWERRDEAGRLLTREAYEAIGGVEGALARHADSVLEELGPVELDLARQVFLRLVTPEGTRRVLPRDGLLEGLPPEAGPVLDRLTASRAVVARKGAGVERGRAELELIHESLVTRWARLARWIEESREEVAFLAELGQSAALWDRRGRRDAEVWQAEALHDALAKASRIAAVPALSRLFLEAGRRREARRTWRARGAVGLIIATLAAVALVIAAKEREAQSGRREAEAARARAEAGRAEAQREGALRAYERGDVLEARARLRQSLETRDSSLGRALWRRLEEEPAIHRTGLSGSWVYDVAVAPGDRAIAVASSNHSVYVVDPQTWSIRIHREHGARTLAVAYSPDGRVLASSARGGTITVADEARGVTRLVGLGGDVGSIGIDAGGERLAATGEDGAAAIWDLSKGLLLRSLVGHEGRLTAVRFSPDGRELATAGIDGTVRLWDPASGAERRVLRSGGAEVLSVDYSADGALLAAGDGAGAVTVWDARAGAVRRVLSGHEGGVHAVRFAPTGRLLATAGDDRVIRLWKASTGEQRRVLEGHGAPVKSLAFMDAGRVLVSGAEDETLRLWDLSVLARRRPESWHAGGVTGVAWSPDGSTVATVGYDGRLVLSRSEDGARLASLGPGPGRSLALAWSPDGRLLAMPSGDDGEILLWDARQRTVRRVLRGRGGLVWGVAWSGDGRRLAAASWDGSIRLWDVADGRQVARLRGHGDRARDVCFAAGGRELVSAGDDRVVRRWELEGLAEGPSLGVEEAPVWGVAASPEGDRIATAALDGAVKVRDAASGRVVFERELPGRAYRVRFDPTGRRLAASCARSEAVVWDLEAGAERALEGHGDEVNDVAWSPDGARLATVSDDDTLRLWDAATGRPLLGAPLLATRPPELLTASGWAPLSGEAPPAPAAAWRRAAEERAALGAESKDGRVLCLAAEGGTVELWDPGSDRMIARARAEGPTALAAGPRGCVVLAGGRASRLGPDGALEELAPRASAVAAAEDADLVATEEGALAFAPRGSGRPARRYPGPGGATAVARVGRGVAAGFADGTIELLAAEGEEPLSARAFERTPGSAVVAMVAGPMETLAVGYANGLVGLFSLETGERLDAEQLNGSVRHLLLEGGRLHAATELGDRTTLDLSVFLAERCALLRAVFRAVPFVWEQGRPVRRPPPSDHPCRRGR